MRYNNLQISLYLVDVSCDPTLIRYHSLQISLNLVDVSHQPFLCKVG